MIIFTWRLWRNGSVEACGASGPGSIPGNLPLISAISSWPLAIGTNNYTTNDAVRTDLTNSKATNTNQLGNESALKRNSKNVGLKAKGQRLMTILPLTFNIQTSGGVV